MATWAELENGIRFTDAACPGCGRRTYARALDVVIRCDGCGEVTEACLCPSARPLDVLS